MANVKGRDSSQSLAQNNIHYQERMIQGKSDYTQNKKSSIILQRILSGEAAFRRCHPGLALDCKSSSFSIRSPST
jgi:hypothetical protein